MPSVSRAIAWVPAAASSAMWVSVQGPGPPRASQAVRSATWFSSASVASP